MIEPIDYTSDPEYKQWEDFLCSGPYSLATCKTYRTNYRRLRGLINNNIGDCSEDTLIDAIKAAELIVNTEQALLNIALMARKHLFTPPLSTVKIKQVRTDNKQNVEEQLKQVNKYIALPTLEEFDDYLNWLFEQRRFQEYVVNWLIRFCNVRNQDLIMYVVTAKRDANDPCKNYIWLESKRQRAVYIRNVYKTSKTYGPKEIELTDECFLYALKRSKASFPITNDPSHIGYYIQKMSYKQLGEGNLLKILINHYKNDVNELEKISKNRGTNWKTLMTSYNCDYQ